MERATYTLGRRLVLYRIRLLHVTLVRKGKWCKEGNKKMDGVARFAEAFARGKGRGAACGAKGIRKE